MILYSFKIGHLHQHSSRWILLLLCFCSCTSFSVVAQERCGVHLIPSNKEYSIVRNDHLAQSRNSSFYIPVVFHVFTISGQMPISEFVMQEQLDILNENYNQLNAPSTLYTEARNVAADPNISFYLAEEDPFGRSTTGILYYDTDDLSLGNIDLQGGPRKVKNGSLGGADAWNTTKYLNIWVTPRDDGILGDSSFPKTNRPNEDGVVIKTEIVGYQSKSERFGMGKTLVHEIGHFLGLRHPFGSAELCLDNDNIEDTPIQERAYFGCPVHPQESCGSQDLIYNFMDFHDDICLRFFTQGQVDFMHHILNTCRSELIENGGPMSSSGNQLENIITYYNGTQVLTYDPTFRPLDLQISIYDITGRFLASHISSEEIVSRISASAYSSGIYLIHIENENDYVTRKIFISN